MFTASTVDPVEQGTVGPRFRAQLPGDETDFVHAFVQQSLPGPTRGLERAVFIEPKIDGAFPDVVAVYWDPRVAAQWPAARQQLEKRDLRVLHACYEAGDVDALALEARLGKAPAQSSLHRLVAAGVLRRLRTRYQLRPLHAVFAVRRLVAIEAKLGDYRRGLEQAIQNTWFASDSYLLAKGRPRDEGVLELAKRTGVQIVGSSDALDVAPMQPHSAQLPRSYCSWLFNEWTWRLRGGADGRVPVSARLAHSAVP